MRRTVERWTFVGVLLSLIGYAAADEDAAVFVLGVPAAIVAWMITRGSPPRTLPRIFINLLLFVVVAWGSLSLFSDGLGVSLFSEFVAALMVVKLLDRRGCRDIAQLITLSVFLMIGAILTSNAFLLGLLVLAYVPVLIGCVLWYQLARVEELSSGHDDPRGWVGRPVRRRVWLIAPASLLIASIIFLLMPREIGSRAFGSWGAASVGQVVGFNDEIRLGMGGLISESNDPVIDLELYDAEGNPLGAVGQRFYLRGAVLDHYDLENGAWTRSDENGYEQGPSPIFRSRPTAVTGGRPRVWTIRQEATIRNISAEKGHLFSIWKTNQVHVDPPARLEFSRKDGTLRVQNHSGKVTYTVYSHDRQPPPDNWTEPTAADRAACYIDLPQAAAIARDALRRAGIEPDPAKRSAADDAEAVSILRNIFTAGDFRYTLETLSAPPGRDPVEWFLTESKAGHCEYFASALAVLCRTVGIDARVVTGYVATDFNETTQSYIVRASNAHAWVEAETLPGHWKTIDPTPSADLARIHEPPRGLLADARRLFDTLEFAWIRAVVGYDAEARSQMLGPAAQRRVLFPMLQRIGQTLEGTRNAPREAMLRAARNALIVFCIAAIAGAAFVRERRRLARLLSAVFAAAAAALLGRPRAHDRPENRIHRDLLDAYRLAGHPKPDWMPLRTHTEIVVDRGVIGTDAGRAAVRLSDRLYAAFFANGQLNPDDIKAAAADLASIREWARSTRPRNSHRRNRPAPGPAADTAQQPPDRVKGS